MMLIGIFSAISFINTEIQQLRTIVDRADKDIAEHLPEDDELDWDGSILTSTSEYIFVQYPQEFSDVEGLPKQFGVIAAQPTDENTNEGILAGLAAQPSKSPPLFVITQDTIFVRQLGDVGLGSLLQGSNQTGDIKGYQWSYFELSDILEPIEPFSLTKTSATKVAQKQLQPLAHEYLDILAFASPLVIIVTLLASRFFGAVVNAGLIYLISFTTSQRFPYRPLLKLSLVATIPAEIVQQIAELSLPEYASTFGLIVFWIIVGVTMLSLQRPQARRSVA